MDHKEVVSILSKISKDISASEQIPVSQISLKLKAAVNENPTDTPLITANQIFSKMASKKILISRAELNDIYNKLYTTSTCLGEVLASDLMREEGPKNRINRNTESKPVDLKIAADSVLSNAFEAIFAKEGYKTYSTKMAGKAEHACNNKLISLGMQPKKVDVYAGNEKIIVCAATFETAKGDVDLLVPVETDGDLAALPETFISDEGPTPLSEEDIEAFIQVSAGKRQYVDGQKLVEALSKPSMFKAASEVDKAIFNMRIEKAHRADIPNSIIGLKMVEAGTIVDLPKVQPQEEHISFAKRVESKEGAAGFVFGKVAVDSGRDFIIRKLASFGFNSPQVSVLNANDSTIQYGVKLSNWHGFTVPVKVEGKTIVPPKFIVSAGEMKSFDKGGIESTLKVSDVSVTKKVSSCNDAPAWELVEIVVKAMENNDIKKAEEAIIMLGDKNPEAQRMAIATVMSHLTKGAADVSDLRKVASDKTKNKTAEVPYFMTSKVFFPEGA